jgi:hypothetical protein
MESVRGNESRIGEQSLFDACLHAWITYMRIIILLLLLHLCCSSSNTYPFATNMGSNIARYAHPVCQLSNFPAVRLSDRPTVLRPTFKSFNCPTMVHQTSIYKKVNTIYGIVTSKSHVRPILDNHKPYIPHKILLSCRKPSQFY